MRCPACRSRAATQSAVYLRCGRMVGEISSFAHSTATPVCRGRGLTFKVDVSKCLHHRRSDWRRHHHAGGVRRERG